MKTNKRARPQVRTAAGELAGGWEGEAAVFRGVPYAAAPVGDLRFKAPEAHAGWTGVRDAVNFGPACPQLAERHESIPQDEDCLYLNVWAPTLEGKSCPVLVWIHGGGFSTGAGSLPFYAGDRMASAGRMVVVTINYRLGPLGYLYVPGTGDSNAGLRDQLAALKWVRDNIAAFGGDPDNVTIAGQSAGASSVIALVASRTARGLFRRAIAQSPALGEPPFARGEAAWHTHQYLELLGLKPSTVAQLRSLPVGVLLRAARKLETQEARAFHPHPVMQLVRDGETVIHPPLEAIAAGEGKDVDVMIGVNREERAVAPGRKLAAAEVLERYRPVFFDDVEAVYRDYAAARPGGTPAQILMDLSGDQLFRMPALAFAEVRDESGHPAYTYQFDWQSPAAMGACHGLELPFVFDNFAAWRDAPMLKGLDTQRAEPLAHAIQQAWISFARSGNPNHPAIPHWEPYTAARRTTLRIDTVLEAVSDLAGPIKRKRWEAIIKQESRPVRTAGGGAA